jgi:hypothetical protein
MVGVVIGMPAAAGIDGDDVALLRAGGQRRRQFVEIGGGARQPRQADHRAAGRGACAVFANVEPQAVLRGDK